MNENGFETNDPLIFERCKYWDNREAYQYLIEKFVDGRISGIEFEREFLQIWRFDRDRIIDSLKLSYIMRNFESTKLEKFSSLISLELFSDLELFQPDPLFREDYEIDEKELKDRVKKILFEIKTIPI